MTPRIETAVIYRLLSTLLLTLALVAGASEEPVAVLDLESCTPGTVGFYWGLGSVWFELMGPKEHGCRFEYLSEIEAGYSLFDCLAPHELGVFELDPATFKPSFGPDSERWEVEEAIAPYCEHVRSGNFLLEWMDEHDGD